MNRRASSFFTCIAWTAVLLVQSGCASPRSSIVLGLYDVPAQSLHSVRAAGFDVVTPAGATNLAQFLDASAKNKLQVLLPSGAFNESNPLQSREIARLDSHPATWGWYLIDEPDLRDIPPHHVSRVTRSVQRQTVKPGVIVLASGSAAATYGAYPDLLMVDFYPVPWAPVSRFAKEMRLAKFARGDKPFYAVVQAFDWTHFADVLGQTNNLRLPTIAEIRCMSYMALALEARGLFFYSFQAKTWALDQSPLWPELKDLVSELRLHSPFFELSPLWWPTDVEFSDPAAMYNEVHDSAILSRLYHLREERNGFPPGYYFLIVNTTGRGVGYSFRLPFADSSKVQLSTEQIRLENSWLRGNYQPFEVAWVGPFAQPTFPIHK